MTRKSVSEISMLAALLGMFAGGIFSFNRPLLEIFIVTAIAGLVFFLVAYFFISFIYSSELKKEEVKEDDEIRIMQNELNRLVEMKRNSAEKRAGKKTAERPAPDSVNKGKNLDLKAGGGDDDIRTDVFGRGK